jgi:hypothetical protein
MQPKIQPYYVVSPLTSFAFQSFFCLFFSRGTRGRESSAPPPCPLHPVLHSFLRIHGSSISLACLGRLSGPGSLQSSGYYSYSG